MRFFNMLNRIVYSSLRKFKTFLFFANKDEKIGSVYCRQLNFEQNINMMPLYCKVRGYQFCKYPFIQRFLVLGGKLIQNEKSFKEKMCLDIVVSTPKTTNLYFSSFFFVTQFLLDVSSVRIGWVNALQVVKKFPLKYPTSASGWKSH